MMASCLVTLVKSDYWSHCTWSVAPLLNADSKTAIPGEYIVILKKNADCKFVFLCDWILYM